MSKEGTGLSSCSVLDPSQFPQSLSSSDQDVYVELRYDPLDLIHASKFIRSPSAGANVIFLGTTRNNFEGKLVSHLSYEAYPRLALQTLSKLASDVKARHNLTKVIIVHRLGEVPIAEESIVVGVSSGHRGECWQGAEELLERVKERAEIWKREWFMPTEDAISTKQSTWKANQSADKYGRILDYESGCLPSGSSES